MDLLNHDNFCESIYNLCKDHLSEDDFSMYESVVEDYAYTIAEDLFKDFRKYVYKSDYAIPGNLAQIDISWDCDKQYHDPSIASLEEFTDFRDLVKAADENRLTEQQLKDAQEWCDSWFWFMAGTWGITYNLDTIISELEYEREQEALAELEESLAS